MPEREKHILTKMGELILAMPEDKKEYFAGVVDGIALMSQPGREQEIENALGIGKQ